MSRNRSLDEFVSGTDEPGDPASDDGSEDSTTDGGPTDPETTDDSTDAATTDVEPLEATYDWTPDGAACDACGAVSEARWRDGDDLVCEACKAW